MKIVNVHEAKTHLSRLLEAVSKGEEMLIAKNGRPVARLMPIERPSREPGRLAGRIRTRDDFDAPLPETIASALKGEAD